MTSTQTLPLTYITSPISWSCWITSFMWSSAARGFTLTRTSNEFITSFHESCIYESTNLFFTFFKIKECKLSFVQIPIQLYGHFCLFWSQSKNFCLANRQNKECFMKFFRSLVDSKFVKTCDEPHHVQWKHSRELREIAPSLSSNQASNSPRYQGSGLTLVAPGFFNRKRNGLISGNWKCGTRWPD